MQRVHNKHIINLKAATLLAAFLAFHTLVVGQMTLSLGNIVSCNNNEVNIPLHVSEFNEVNAITLKIQIDTLFCNYNGLTNPNNNLAGASLITNISYASSSALINISWQRMSPITISDDKLFDIVLNYKEGSSSLSFTGGCEIASGLTPVENVNYLNGSINKQPQSLFIAEGETAMFSVNYDNESTYLWQFNSGEGWNDLSNSPRYSGVYSHELVISNTTLDLSNNTYRCIVNHNECEIISSPATLKVSPMSINEHNHQSDILNVFPNPNHGILYCEVNSPLEHIDISIVDMLGNKLWTRYYKDLPANHSETINTGLFKQGVYILQLISDEIVQSTVKVIIK
ncbi:MAG TPA: T9SS type A sorting domain-containing protein [Bacteroidales bacterium]|nr:T9SS type A sorting domain-containing protein [Bacteroidales bacterium]